jgi:hypothetical protein
MSSFCIIFICIYLFHSLNINKSKIIALFVGQFFRNPKSKDVFLTFARATLLVHRKTQLVRARGRDRGPAAVHMRKCKLQVSELKVHDS